MGFSQKTQYGSNWSREVIITTVFSIEESKNKD